MSYYFDIPNKVIELTDTEPLDMLDVYSRWKEEVISNIQMAGQDQAIRVVKEPLAGNTFIGPYYFMMNNWRIHPFDTNYELIVSGSVLQDATSTETPFKTDDLTSNVQIVRTVAAEVQVVENATAEEIATAVWAKEIT